MFLEERGGEGWTGAQFCSVRSVFSQGNSSSVVLVHTFLIINEVSSLFEKKEKEKERWSGDGTRRQNSFIQCLNLNSCLVFPFKRLFT